MVITNSVAAISAAMVSNCIVFHLHGIVFLLYLCVAATSGAIFGVVGCEIDTRGVQLCDILSLAGASSYTQVTLVAEDEYSAAVTAEEVDADVQVYVILQEDGGWQLVVFGDPYSKLNVSDLSRIIVT